MASTLSTQFSVNNAILNLLCVSLHGENIPLWVEDEAKEAFQAIAPFVKNVNHVLYVRDLPTKAIDGMYPSGNCYNQHEAMVALRDWRVEKQQLVGTFNHELHHMARWQHAGYGTTIGGAILSEGIATYCEVKTSDWLSPWVQAALTKEAVEAAASEWDKPAYNHADWFFRGRYGRWTGYGIGYQLATKLFANGFDLESSLTVTPDDAKYLLKQL